MKLTDKIRITNEDNMELMARYPDNYFELAIVDPPYGINMGKKRTIGKRGKTYSITNYIQSEWDNAIPKKEYFNELFRVSKNQIIFGANYFNHFLPPSQGWFVYNKNQPDGFSMAQAELAYTSFDRSIRLKSFKRNLVQNCVSNNKQIALANAKIHQCQKPIVLYKYLLDTYAKPNDKILDTHLGSGSIAIACHDYGFELTACELDKEYYDKAIQRIKNHVSQQKLF